MNKKRTAEPLSPTYSEQDLQEAKDLIIARKQEEESYLEVIKQ